MGTIGIPTKLLHESLGHIVTLELKGGQSYRGKLFDAEDNLNCSLKDVVLTARDGKQSHLDSVYIRGSMIRFIVVPDMLQQAPMFKRVGPNAMKGRGIGAARGRATIMRGEFQVTEESAATIRAFVGICADVAGQHRRGWRLHSWMLTLLTCADNASSSSLRTAQSRRGRGAPSRGQGIRR